MTRRSGTHLHSTAAVFFIRQAAACLIKKTTQAIELTVSSFGTKWRPVVSAVMMVKKPFTYVGFAFATREQGGWQGQSH